MPLDRSRLIVGTAQLTEPYGIYAAQAGRDSAADILRFAVSCGIRAFDTAALYGGAERELGRFAAAEGGIEIVTKCMHLPVAASGGEKAALVERSARASLAALGLKRIPVFLIHNAQAFDIDVARKLDTLKAEGIVGRAGVSIYSGEDIDRVMATWLPDVVQLPVNLFDQRLIASGHIARLRMMNVELHARSVFLQGVLLGAPSALPAWLTSLAPRLQLLAEETGAASTARAAACLGFVAQIAGIGRIVVGVQNREQLRQIVEAADSSRATVHPERFAVDDPALVDPSRWPQ